MPLVPDQLRQLAGKVPDEVAFSLARAGRVDDLTFREWDVEASRFGRGLIERGVGKGDRVAIITAQDDAHRFVVAYAGVHKAGAVAVPVNVRLSPGEVAGILNHAEPTAIVASNGLRHLVRDERAPQVKVLVATGDSDGDAVAWSDVPAGDETDLQVPTDEDELAEILYTSGTTGAPKGVAIKHCNSSLMLLTDPPWSGQVFLHASPLSTFAGLAFVYQPMRMGMRAMYMAKFDPARWVELVETYKPMMCFLVPAMVELLLSYDGLQSADLSSVHMFSVGSAPVAPAALERLQALVPNAAVSNSYSMTEAGTAYFIVPKGELLKRPGSVGMPVPPAEVRIVDEDGKAVASGDVGEVEIKPAGKPREYYKDPAATAALFRGEWLRTGDLGRFDEDGYLYIVGREKDVIIRGGFNVYASDVEHALYEHPAVREAAVVGVPHAVLGEDIAAVVVVSDEVSAEALIAHCKERLADYKVPRRVEFVAELPRNATGKVLKRELVEQLNT